MKYLNTDCKFLKLTNLGTEAIEFIDTRMSNNIYFSVPASQMPIKINPGESKDIVVCFKQEYGPTGILRDTLSLFTDCYTKKVNMKATSIVNLGSLHERCDIPIRFKVGESPESSEISKISPNPASDIASIEYYLDSNSEITLDLYDNRGATRKSLLTGHFAKGSYLLKVNIAEMPSGIYHVVLMDGKNVSKRTFVVE